MTIVDLAQDIVGSNNINLLLPNGQFGTRDQGGKDHAGRTMHRQGISLRSLRHSLVWYFIPRMMHS
jgi:hypothetical protein